MLAHGAVLRKNMFTAEQVEAIVTDFHNAGLEPGEVAMMDYAQKVIRKARDVTQEDIDELHTHGFSDAEILDITMTAAARSFFSKVLNAVGAEPDAEYMELEDSLREALTVGRPFGNGQ